MTNLILAAIAALIVGIVIFIDFGRKDWFAQIFFHSFGQK